MVRAILKDGRIEPIDPFPAHWREGSELLIEDLDGPPLTKEQMDKWLKDCDEAAASLTDDDWKDVEENLREQDRLAKDQVRREMGLD